MGRIEALHPSGPPTLRPQETGLVTGSPFPDSPLALMPALIQPNGSLTEPADVFMSWLTKITVRSRLGHVCILPSTFCGKPMAPPAGLHPPGGCRVVPRCAATAKASSCPCPWNSASAAWPEGARFRRRPTISVELGLDFPAAHPRMGPFIKMFSRPVSSG